MENIVIAVCGIDCGTTPPMPYIGERLDGKHFTLQCRLCLESALLRCGFDIADRRQPVADPQDIIMQATRYSADCTVAVSYSKFGSGKSFNDICGCTVKYAQSRMGTKSRTLGEDICAKLRAVKHCEITAADYAWNAANCPTVVVDGGYLTQFDEAKLTVDPDYIKQIAEHIAMGICEYFGMPYVPYDDISAYHLQSDVIGKHDRKVKLLQTLLAANGAELEIDGIFGKTTDTALKSFCANNGIQNDGAFTAVWRELTQQYIPQLKLGSKHCGVQYLQKKLYSKLYKTPITGVLDDDTLRTINEFINDTDRNINPCENYVHKEAIKLISAVGGGKPRLF